MSPNAKPFERCGSAPAFSQCVRSVGTPFVVVATGRIIYQCKISAAVAVPEDFNETDVAIHETNHVSGVMKQAGLIEGRLFRLMPRVREKSRIICNQNRFCRLPNRGQAPAGDVGAVRAKNQPVSSVESVARKV